MIITYSWLDQYKIIGINDTTQYFGGDALPKYKASGILSDSRTVFGTLSDKKPIATIAGN